MCSQSGASCATEFCDPDMVSRNRKHREIWSYFYEWDVVWWKSQIRQAFLLFLPILTEQQVVKYNQRVKTLKDVVKQWPGGVKMHDVQYMWSCRKVDTYDRKKLNNNQDRDAKMNKRSM